MAGSRRLKSLKSHSKDGVLLVRRIEYRQLANILALFLIVQLAGAAIAFYFLSPQEVSVMVSSSPASTGGGIIFYFIYIVVVAIAMVLLFRIFHGNLLFRLIEGFVIGAASFYLFLIIFGSFVVQDSGIYAIAISLGLAVALVVAKNKWPGLRNLAAVIASVGVGVVLGSFFNFSAAYALMAFIAVYDYIAVFVTRHMIALGRESVNRNLAFMIGSYDVEVVPENSLRKSEIREVREAMGKGPVRNPAIKEVIKEGGLPLPSFSALGTGDLAMPLMLALSAYFSFLSFLSAILIIIGSTFGLIFAMYISKKYKVALPAIPPLFAFASFALGLDLIIRQAGSWQFYALLFVVGIGILILMLVTARRQSRLGESARISRKAF